MVRPSQQSQHTLPPPPRPPPAPLSAPFSFPPIGASYFDRLQKYFKKIFLLTIMTDVRQLLSLARAPGSSASSTSVSSSERGETVQNGGGTTAGKRNIAQLAAEKIEPYVRKRRCSGSSSERSRKRRENLSEKDQNILRLNINSRERKRMHDLNDALDDLRKAFPFAVNGERAGARKLSKIDTIVLAKNWILQLNKELAELRANNERLLLEVLAVKTNGQNGKTVVAAVGTNGKQQKTDDDQSAAAAIGTASTSAQRNTSQSSGTGPCPTFGAVGSVGLLSVPPSRIPSADANSVLPPPFVPFTAPMLAKNGAFLMQEKSNQILENAFAVQHLLAMKSANNFRHENGGVGLFGRLPTGLFPANFQMPTNEEPRNEAQVSSNRKRKTNGGKKEEKKKGIGESDQRKSIGKDD